MEDLFEYLLKMFGFFFIILLIFIIVLLFTGEFDRQEAENLHKFKCLERYEKAKLDDMPRDCVKYFIDLDE